MWRGITMEPQAREAWINALRSGNYDQAIGLLADGEGGFCCLGIQAVDAGCTVRIKHVGRGLDRQKMVIGMVFPRGKANKIERGEPPMFWWRQFFTFDSSVKDDDKEAALTKLMEKLIELNDEEGISLSEIADWIEENL